jgi:hypothetical protein
VSSSEVVGHRLVTAIMNLGTQRRISADGVARERTV